MSGRAEFTKAVRLAARACSGGKCEAVGTMYRLDPGKRCGARLTLGCEFDHIILEANSHENSLENCACVCIPCHRIKTRMHDTPLAAKTVRQLEKLTLGITKTKQPWPKGRRMGQRYESNARDINE